MGPDFLSNLKIIGIVLGVIGFGAIVFWAYWPSRRSEMDANARIPLEEKD